MDKPKSNNKILIRIAQAAGAFAFIISMMLIVNYIQYKNIDPVNTELINNLITRLNETPEDSVLRDQIRELDLLARKAYFTNQWQVRTGGYLLLICITVLIITLRIIRSRAKLEITFDEHENIITKKKNTRTWLSVSGIIIVGLALLSALFSINDLNSIIDKQLVTLKDETIEIAKSEPINEPVRVQDELVELPASEPESNTETELSVNKPEVEKSAVVTKTESKPEAGNQERSKPTEETKEPVKEEKVPVEKKELPVAKPSYPSEKKITENHPAFRGPGSNGISYRKNIPVSWDGTTGENILWKLKVPLHGYNSPVIWGNKVFLSGATAEKREVYCIDRNTGNVLWTYDVTGIPGSPEKSPKTTDDTGLAAPSVTTDGESVYAIFGNGDLVAIDMDGNEVWSKNLGPTGNHYGHSSSLIYYQDILILQYDTKSSPMLMGLSVKTGETLWTTNRDVKISWASPICVNTGSEYEVIIAADPIVASYNPLTGEENWQIDCIFGEVGPSVAYSDGVVFAVNEYAKLAAIKIGETPEILWEDDEYLSDVPSPVATEDILIMATSYGVVVSYDSKTGEKYWEQEFDNGFYSSPMLVEDKIYLMDMDGVTHIMKAGKQYEALGESPIGENAMTTPAFSDGRIYIRGNEHLFCIGK